MMNSAQSMSMTCPAAPSTRLPSDLRRWPMTRLPAAVRCPVDLRAGTSKVSVVMVGSSKLELFAAAGTHDQGREGERHHEQRDAQCRGVPGLRELECVQVDLLGDHGGRAVRAALVDG